MRSDQIAGERRAEDLVERELLLREREPRGRACEHGGEGERAREYHAPKIHMAIETGKPCGRLQTAQGPEGRRARTTQGPNCAGPELRRTQNDARPKRRTTQTARAS